MKKLTLDNDVNGDDDGYVLCAKCGEEIRCYVDKHLDMDNVDMCFLVDKELFHKECWEGYPFG